MYSIYFDNVYALLTTFESFAFRFQCAHQLFVVGFMITE